MMRIWPSRQKYFIRRTIGGERGIPRNWIVCNSTNKETENYGFGELKEKTQ